MSLIHYLSLLLIRVDFLRNIHDYYKLNIAANQYSHAALILQRSVNTVQIGIVGLPKAGKTTIFNAITGASASTASYSGSGEEINVAMVSVPDERLDFLFDHFQPRRKVQVELKFVDFAGVRKSASRAESGFSTRNIADMRNCDALMLVLRSFTDDSVPHPSDRIDPSADLENLLLEFSFADLAIVEKKIARYRDAFNKLSKDEKAIAQKELPILERLAAILEDGGLISDAGLDEEEEKLLRSYGFLTLKPMIVIINTDDSDAAGDPPALRMPPSLTTVMKMAGNLEMEISRLEDPEEQREFLADAGIETPASARAIRQAFNSVGLIYYFTAGGKDEVAAWTIHEGDNAVIAASKIHSDIARGFIRAEVVAFDDFKACGDFAKAREAGKFRLEGKDYIVKDGDIINFRFNV